MLDLSPLLDVELDVELDGHRKISSAVKSRYQEGHTDTVRPDSTATATETMKNIPKKAMNLGFERWARDQ